MYKILFFITFCLVTSQVTVAQTSFKQKLIGTWVTSGESVSRMLTFNSSGEGLQKEEYFDEVGERFSIILIPFSHSVKEVSENACLITFEQGKITKIRHGKQIIDTENSYTTISNTYFFEGKNILLEYGGNLGNTRFVGN